jgi:ribosomal protein S18/ribosomal protein S6
MIYELCVVQSGDATDESVAKLTETLRSTLSEYEGELMIQDNWGVKTFAQPTSTGKETGNFSYFIFKANSGANTEIARRLRIDESVLKFASFKLGEDGEKKDRKRFSKGKHCFFKSNNIIADWKDPKTYSWLVNEFGKISAARVSGVSRKHQRYVTTAIKRARNLGIISHISNRTIGQ